MDLTQTPFDVGDRVRIIVDIFNQRYGFGTEHTIVQADIDGWYAVDDHGAFLRSSDLELVERAS